MAESVGFHKTQLPISAGAAAKLPPIAVKLNGVIAAQKPYVKRIGILKCKTIMSPPCHARQHHCMHQVCLLVCISLLPKWINEVSTVFSVTNAHRPNIRPKDLKNSPEFFSQKII